MSRLFPNTCVDDFFEDPDYIRNTALDLEFSKSPEGKYPGERTDYLHNCCPDIFESFCNNFFKCFYDLRDKRLEWIVTAHFQKIVPFENEGLNRGWVHLDNNSLVGGVVYLNPKVTNPSGTIVCDIKQGEIFDFEQDLKHQFNMGNIDDHENYIASLDKNHAQFSDSVSFANKYNRMICFDGTAYHKVESFNVGTEPRLTLVFFVNEIKSNWFPLKNIVN